MRRPSPALLVACLALFVALGGPAQAAKLVSGSTIRANTITSKQVKEKSLSVTDLSTASQASLRRTAAGSVAASELRDGGVGRADLAADAVDAGKVLDGSIGALDLAASSVFADELAPNAVGGAAVITEGVGSRALAPNSVGAEEVGSGAVGAAEVADGTLGAADLGRFAGTTGNLLLGNLAPGDCTSQTTTSLTAVAAGQDISDDAVVLTPPAGFPDGVVVNARPEGANQLRVTACNLGGAGAALGSPTFRFVTFEVG